MKIYHGILYFQNENLIKDERIVDDAENSVLAETILTISYDSENNALRNILGFDKLLDYSKMISSNNEILSTVDSSVKYIDDNQVISEIKRYDSEYQYNTNGYPAEIVSENIMFGGSDSKHLKSQLFYN